MATEPLVGSFQFEQVGASTTWTITHNLNTTNPIVDCWIDDNGTEKRIFPTTIFGTSNLVCTLTFVTAVAGKALVV
jgi:hypothetical protein